MINGLEHVGLSVADLDRALAFYRDLLGFTLLRVLDCGPETKLGRVVGMPGCRARIAHLLLGETMVELFAYIDPKGRTLDADSCQADHGWIHVGLTSDDVRADYDRLRAAGVEFVSAPVEFRPGVWIVYFRGPDGEVLELRQTPPDDNAGAVEPLGSHL